MHAAHLEQDMNPDLTLDDVENRVSWGLAENKIAFDKEGGTVRLEILPADRTWLMATFLVRAGEMEEMARDIDATEPELAAHFRHEAAVLDAFADALAASRH